MGCRVKVVVRLCSWKSEVQSFGCNEDISVGIVNGDCTLVQDGWTENGVSDESESCWGVDGDWRVGVGNWIAPRSLDIVSRVCRICSESKVSDTREADSVVKVKVGVAKGDCIDAESVEDVGGLGGESKDDSSDCNVSRVGCSGQSGGLVELEVFVKDCSDSIVNKEVSEQKSSSDGSR